MGFLVRRSWSRQNDPTLWDRPVNQASKWLAQLSGSQRILSEGGTASLTNSDTRKFALSVFLGDGGVVTIGGSAPNASTAQISRVGNTITVTIKTEAGTASTKTFTTNAPFWSNVYLRGFQTGTFNNQVTITAMVDFNQTQQMVATGALAGDQFRTNDKTLECNSLSGWAWFSSTSGGGIFGWWATSNIPIDDVKYREAFINNATWDVVPPGTNWSRPNGVRYARAWIYQGGGGGGGSGGDGGDGWAAPADSSQQDGTGGKGGDGGSGRAGGRGGNGGNGGWSGAQGDPGGSGYPGLNGSGRFGGNGGSGGNNGAGGSGGAGANGKYNVAVILRVNDTISGGVGGAKGNRGTNGATGTAGSSGANGTSASKNGKNGTDGGNATGTATNGTNGNDGTHCTFCGVVSSDGQNVSDGKTTYGITTLNHGLGIGGSSDSKGSDGGVVLYYQW